MTMDSTRLPSAITNTTVKGPPVSLPKPLVPLEVRPSFSRSRSQQNLASPTRLYNTVSSALGRSRVDLLSSPSSEQPPAVPPLPACYAPSPSAFATIQKVYHSNEDISFWSSLYSQHHIHTRQENQEIEQQQRQQQQQGSSDGTSPAARSALAAAEQQQQQHCVEAIGSIKVWQVLTKTVLDNSTTKPTQETQQQQQPLSRPNLHFERLPIKVQTSASALSPDGKPFSIVFFFTVESSPMTLWYLESAFTQSSTVHEHMELMGTFQPNNPRDPTSFYIYETHAFNVVQPLQEDTMLDIHVQNPAGTIYAEFSYTFIKEPKVVGSASSVSTSTLSMPNSPRTTTGQEKHSRNSSSNDDTTTDGIIAAATTATTIATSLLTTTATRPAEMPLSPVQSPLDNSYDLIERESPSSPGYFPVFKDEPSPSYSSSPSPSSSTKRTESSVPSLPSSSVISESSTQTSLYHPVTVAGIEHDVLEPEDDEEEEPETVFVESLSEEPDAGEHFMQATSEFFSKMGYWLYNSKVIQYIARDDRTRIKTLFQTDDIWILGVNYTFDQSEPPLSLHEAPRSRKSSMLQAHSVGVNRPGGGAGALGGGDSKGNSVSSYSPGSDNGQQQQEEEGQGQQQQPKRMLDRPRSHTVSSPRERADSDAHSRMSTFSRKQDNNYMDSPRSRSKERKLEKQREKELAKEAAKAKKLARAKERELEREQERQHERERAKEKARLKEQEKIQKFKAKISHPHFDRNSNVDGSRHLSAIIALDSKEHGYLNVQREPERKSQSIHGYQHEYRANVGLGLSTDTIDPTQQREDAAKEFSQEPAPMDSSPEHSPPPPGSRPSAKQRLLHLPSALLTNLPRQRSPSSPSLALNKPWRAVSPRSPTSRSTLPLVAAMTSPSMPSLPILSSHHSSPQSANMEYPIGILDLEDTLETRPDSLSRRDLSSSSRFSTSSHLSVERPVSIPLPSPNRATLARFMADFESRIWFTYRKDIARIEPSFYTSDAGWGCMMRTGQSLLAQAFVQIMLGRDWRADSSASEESCQKYSTLLSWFADEPDRYYGIHSIAKAGVALDKRVGEWFGPSTVAHALRRLSYKHPDCPVAVVVSMDNTIRISELVHAATGKDNRNAQSDIYGAGPGSPDPQQPQQQHRRQRSGYWKPVVVMMPARYGLDKLKEGYVGNLKQLFKLPQFLGIAGGRPGRSLYFVAYQGNDLFYFDPHIVKARATHEEMTHCPSPSYHCNVVRTMDIMELDPSMMLGFLIRSMKDLAELLAQLKHGMDQHYPLFTIIGNPAPAASSASSPTSAPVTVPTLGEKLPVNGASTIVSSPVTGVPSPVQAAYPFETEKEKEKEKEETKSVRIESAVVALERVQLDQGQWSPVKTAVVVEEEENIVPAQETTTKTITTSTTITTTTISTTIRTIPNLDAPLPALPQEQDYAPAPPPPRPLSTSPEEGRPKKEMKRITKAFQKERWMVKPKSNKDKKGGSSPPVEQVPIADRIVYKYASEGDAVVVHDEDTLSVKSFDSDISL